MKWIGKRISFVDEKFRTTVVIHPKEDNKVKALMGAWFGMWLTIGAIVIWSYFTFDLTDQERVIIYVFMAFWLYYAVRVGRGFFWLLWGKELLKIDETALHHFTFVFVFLYCSSYLLNKGEYDPTHIPSIHNGKQQPETTKTT